MSPSTILNFACFRASDTAVRVLNIIGSPPAHFRTTTEESTMDDDFGGTPPSEDYQTPPSEDVSAATWTCVAERSFFAACGTHTMSSNPRIFIVHMRPSYYPMHLLYAIQQDFTATPVKKKPKHATTHRTPLSPSSPNTGKTPSGAQVRWFDASIHHPEYL